MIYRFVFFACLLASCTVPGSAGEKAANQAAESAARGGQTFQAQCASCHGAAMQGGMGGSLTDDEWSYGGGDADILRAINGGIEEAGMPAFGETLSWQEQRDLLAFIRKGDVQAAPPAVDDVRSLTSQVQVKDWITGLDEPWGFVFTGDDDAVITEKPGALRIVENGALLPGVVAGIPEVTDKGQGGLLDVAIDPDYEDNGWIYLAFSDPAEGGKAMTKIVRGRIRDMSWVDQQVLFAAKPEHYVKSRVHFGSRITFGSAVGDDGYLYFSIGDRGQKEQAQDITRPNGKIHRIHRDGRIPDDNPFAGQDEAYGSIYTYGNRNPQGLIVHPETGVIWETEHGPRGGDELNVIKPGVNYGWPEISYGRNYSGTELTPHTALPGMAQPVSQWTPSIAVCGLEVYTGDLFPGWRGRLLAGSLKNETLRLVDVDGQTYGGEAVILKDEGRVRDVTTGPDGAIYAVLEGRIVRLSPKE